MSPCDIGLKRHLSDLMMNEKNVSLRIYIL